MNSISKANILLVDDYLNNLLALEAILENLGHNLVRANSGKEALDWLLKEDFALILLDVKMPDMDGFETAALIRKQEKTRYTPIIFVTAFYNTDEYVTKAYTLGAADYLVKPVEPEELVMQIATLTGRFGKISFE
jgi:CheY-like chemotaxis protein